MTRNDVLIRPARKEDASTLANLINIAGEGIPLWLWRQSTSTDKEALALGAERAARDSGGFSYSNAHVAELRGEVVAMLLGYRLADSAKPEDFSSVPAVVRPLLELEMLAPGTWYLNAIATLDRARGVGLGTKLLELSHKLARQSGAATLSLIVASGNKGALRLYEREGYRKIATRPIVGFSGFHHTGDWILMTSPVKN